MSSSIIYKNIYIYRAVMNALYFFKYKQRFNDIIALLSDSDKQVLDLCFGDAYIAQHCEQQNKNWIGYDTNSHFVKFAKSKGFDARCADLFEEVSLPKSDVCIISGSLYHFEKDLERLFKRMLQAAPKLLISEPVVNLSSQKGFIGSVAKKLSNAGKGEEQFRFNETSIIETLNKLQGPLCFSYKVISIKRDIVIEIKQNEN